MFFMGKDSYHVSGCCMTDAKEFPVWRITKNLSEEKKVPFQDVHITFWTKISKYEYEKLGEEYSL